LKQVLSAGDGLTIEELANLCDIKLLVAQIIRDFSTFSWTELGVKETKMEDRGRQRYVTRLANFQSNITRGRVEACPPAMALA